jgi:hypothetical protein
MDSSTLKNFGGSLSTPGPCGAILVTGAILIVALMLFFPS